MSTMRPPKAWTIRAGRGDEFDSNALQRGMIGLGWRRVGDLRDVRDRDSTRKRVDSIYRDVSAGTREAITLQLNAFRSDISPGDMVVLLRDRSPDVAVGIVEGDYVYEASAAAGIPPHTRSVRWLHRNLPRPQLDDDLVRLSGLSVLAKLQAPDAAERLSTISESTPAVERRATRVPSEEPKGPAAILQRNLAYARNLAEAGQVLGKLGVASFDVGDIYRAAWTQAVAALDWWVSQEIRERLLQLANMSGAQLPKRLRSITLPIGTSEDVRAGRLSFRDAIEQQVLNDAFARRSFQSPEAIKEGFELVTDTKLWPGVAKILNERALDGKNLTTKDVEQRLRTAVKRRHKIVHEYDSDPSASNGRTSIDAGATMETIAWIERVTEAIDLVLEKP